MYKFIDKFIFIKYFENKMIFMMAKSSGFFHETHCICVSALYIFLSLILLKKQF